MKLIGKIALLSDLTLSTSKGIILRQDGDGLTKLLEQIIVIPGHFLHEWLSPFICS